MPIAPIGVKGLDQFRKAVKQLDPEAAKSLRLVLNEAVAIVVDDAAPHMPRRTGKAARSLRGASTQGKARVKAGGRQAPYVPWLDFGGKRRGRGGGVATRPFYKQGRYVWKSFGNKRSEVLDRLTAGLVGAARASGLEVSSGGE